MDSMANSSAVVGEGGRSGVTVAQCPPHGKNTASLGMEAEVRVQELENGVFSSTTYLSLKFCTNQRNRSN